LSALNRVHVAIALIKYIVSRHEVRIDNSAFIISFYYAKETNSDNYNKIIFKQTRNLLEILPKYLFP